MEINNWGSHMLFHSKREYLKIMVERWKNNNGREKYYGIVAYSSQTVYRFYLSVTKRRRCCLDQVSFAYRKYWEVTLDKTFKKTQTHKCPSKDLHPRKTLRQRAMNALWSEWFVVLPFQSSRWADIRVWAQSKFRCLASQLNHTP